MIKAIFTIIRPVNVIISMISVYLGGIISFDRYFSIELIIACVSAGLIAGFGNVCNDIFDIEIDRKSKQFRPLPSGRISIKAAIVLAILLVSFGLVLAALINPTCLLIASVAAVALILYTPIYKGKGYRGNLLISFISALAFFFGASATGNLSGGLIPAVFAFMFHFIREIIKDMEDYEADKDCNVKTGVVRYGFRTSKNLAIVMMIILMGATIVPFVVNLYGMGYLLMVIFGTDIFLLYFIYLLNSKPGNRTYRFIAGFMKAIMPLGILAVFIGSRGW